MFNKNSPAGTAAKKRSKYSLLAGRHMLAAILLLCAFSSKAQSAKPAKYRLVWCDTIGNILGVSFKNTYPKKGIVIFLNNRKTHVVNIVHSKYNNGDGRKEIDVYVASAK